MFKGVLRSALCAPSHSGGCSDCHSMIWSAIDNSDCGTVRPIACAASERSDKASLARLCRQRLKRFRSAGLRPFLDTHLHHELTLSRRHQRRLIAFAGMRDIALGLIDFAAAEIRRRVSRIDAYRLIAVGDGTVEIALCDQGIATIVVEFHI